MSRRRTINVATKFTEILKEKGKFAIICEVEQPSQFADDIITNVPDDIYNDLEHQTFSFEDVALFYTMGLMLGVNLKKD